jgi:hypothetical protein
LVYLASETWVGALLEKAFTRTAHVFSQSKASLNKALQHRSASLHWTAFKSRLCGFAAQKYSTKPQLKSCR